ncbi:hypothetical protein DFH09DRAFT_1096151 [Mycena vulgaris]|nr:hypothetical protein DFH09DRAFT_1096151 [Mycena vulgaris]
MGIDATVRIQALAAELGDFTLVTIARELSRQLRLTGIPGLAKDIYASLLTTLELSDHLTHLTIGKHSTLAHSDVMAFIQRHPKLETIAFEPGSIISLPDSSIDTLVEPRIFSGNTRFLSAPAAYIPHVLSAAPNAERISVIIAEGQHLEVDASSALRDYHLALTSIAALAGTHPLLLTLSLNSDANGLPWAHIPAKGEGAVETRLFRVQDIVLSATQPLKFNVPAVRWLGLFPALKRVLFNPNCLKPLSPNEQHALIRDEAALAGRMNQKLQQSLCHAELFNSWEFNFALPYNVTSGSGMGGIRKRVDSSEYSSQGSFFTYFPPDWEMDWFVRRGTIPVPRTLTAIVEKGTGIERMWRKGEWVKPKVSQRVRRWRYREQRLVQTGYLTFWDAKTGQELRSSEKL